MCFVFTCGEHEFSDYLQGYEGVTCQCHNCGNYSAHVLSRWSWFTFCFVPVIPLSTHRYHDVVCNICRFSEPLENRQDVMAGAGNQLQPQNYSGPPQGWNGGQGPGQQGPKPNQNMQYG